MTIEEAVRAARNNTPVIYESPMLGPMLYTRIGCIRKSYPLRRDAADGRAAEEYSLELLSMNGSRSLMVASPERVREATPEEIADIRQYTQSMKMPEVHPELLCEEVKKSRPWADRK